MKKIILFSLAFFILASCVKDKPEKDLPSFLGLMELPSHFPEINFPDDNDFDEKKWALGKDLFYDPIMSVDSTISCSSCHDPSLAFTDNVALSLGVEDRLGTRNAPTLGNVAFQPFFTFEGGLNTLEKQIFVPIQEHNEFDFNIVLLAERLANNSYYAPKIEGAFDRTADAFVITRSLATFERSLISGSSAYDAFILGDQTALTVQEQDGMKLFFSERLACSNCHNGFNFTEYGFENNGLYEDYLDIGRKRLTGLDEDLSLFKTPTLRNIEVTSPYMHDGSFTSLEEVIDHYNSGGENHINKSEKIRELDLTSQEKEDLIAFLKSLTDESFILNPLFQQ